MQKHLQWLEAIQCVCSHTMSQSSLSDSQSQAIMPFLFSLFMSYQRKRHCKTLAYCMNCCIYLFILGKVDYSDACSQNACSQQLEQHSWGSSDLVNRHRNFLFYIKAKCNSFCCVKRKRTTKTKQQTFFLCDVNSCWQLCCYHFLPGLEVILCADSRKHRICWLQSQRALQGSLLLLQLSISLLYHQE